jgi:hypothetical protein
MEIKKLYKRIGPKASLIASLLVGIGISSPVLLACIILPKIPYLLQASIILATAVSMILSIKLWKVPVYNLNQSMLWLSVLSITIVLIVMVI